MRIYYNIKSNFQRVTFLNLTKCHTDKKTTLKTFVCISLGNDPATIVFMSFNTNPLLNPMENALFLLPDPFMLT